MFPLIIVAFAGIGVTRLALLALELHESNNPDEVVSPGEVTVTKEATIEEMRRLEKPAKLVLKNECQYVCIWRDEDLNQDLPLEDLLRSCEREGNGDRTDTSNEFTKAIQEVASFFDRMVGKQPVTPTPAGGNNLPAGVEVSGGQDKGSGLEEGPQSGAVGGAYGDRAAAAVMPPSGEAPRPAACTTAACTTCPTMQDGCDKDVRRSEAMELPSLSRNDSETDMCVVCYDKEQNAVLLTCGHGSLCFHCAIDVFRTTRECPLCRSKVDQIVTVGPKQLLRNGLQVVSVTGP